MIILGSCSMDSWNLFGVVLIVFVISYSCEHDLSSSERYGQLHVLNKRDSSKMKVKRDIDDEFEDGIPLLNETELWVNSTHKTVDHMYYTMHIYKPDANRMKDFWISIPDLIKKNSSVRGKVRHAQLSNSYRKAVSQPLSFKFPFYGHIAQNITIATGGFVYVGEYIHHWLAATQYIAPLMANFDTTVNEESSILYVDTGNTFIIEWSNVQLRKQEKAGNFTFQLSLHNNGDIWFVYKQIPIAVTDVNDLHHPRKVGLSDAYLYTQTTLALNRRMIYEYHRIEVPLEAVQTGAVVEIKANPVCMLFDTCEACMNATLKAFNCSWCPIPSSEGSSFCSDEAGLHRRRQDWRKYKCDLPNPNFYCSSLNETSVDNNRTDLPSEDNVVIVSTQSLSTSLPTTTAESQSVVLTTGGSAANTFTTNMAQSQEKIISETDPAKTSGLSSGGVVSLLFIISSIIGLVGWVTYAYYNPHTRSGQFLIRYRPSKWRLNGNRSGIRYTASVHM
ncbi:Plexin domain-containing protein 2 [Trichinella pseudospiralis]|uniref:Plexin domain-containing protein 2 n=1 Tax=Trichinella pseudospiralis TaxID=6337 RepID=A0A0V0YD83_TRIPS|nr:Plexin domain-containing protein 2 [Trichinella pseudospiralis]